MRRIRLDAGTPLFRAHNPLWSFQPLSGAGAARAGGRFNRIGTPALYLSFEEATCAAEYRQDNDLTEPYLLVAYLARLPELVDLRQLDDDGWDPLWNDWGCDWRQLFVDGTEPPSWALGDIVLDAGELGLIFPSLANPGGLNIVLFTDRLQPEWLEPHDPNGLLPRDQSSWPHR
ncbi:RES domain-containing protein [Lysobacter maris]|uniref:RES domain-containing protein n=1 Tax=Marilutibacter maris TaxID=1605891 RepID=A0A508B3Q0_9GAMM|nr:RES family NAD+ phosphorylase [Lysobacter maris]KAB8198395.1 RES domain-containing protein [Lysobacter maris]